MITDDHVTWVLSYLIVGMVLAIFAIIVERRADSSPNFNGTMMVALLWPVVIVMIVLVVLDTWARGELANLSSQVKRHRSKRRRDRRIR